MASAVSISPISRKMPSLRGRHAKKVLPGLLSLFAFILYFVVFVQLHPTAWQQYILQGNDASTRIVKSAGDVPTVYDHGKPVHGGVANTKVVRIASEQAAGLSTGKNGFIASGEKRDPSRVLRVPILVYLSGELGNHLAQIGGGYVLKWMAEEHGYRRYGFNVTLDIHYRSPKKEAIKRTEQEINQCLVNFRTENLHEYNTPEVSTYMANLKKFYGTDALHVEAKIRTAEDMTHHFFEKLDTVVGALLNFTSHPLQVLSPHINLTGNEAPPPALITSRGFGNWAFAAPYKDRLAKLFAWDYSKCCKSYPESDETVVHIRNFKAEFEKQNKVQSFASKGFEELDPHRLAYDLLGHLSRGDKVTVLSRFADSVEDYKHTMEQRGLDVKVVSGGSGIEDFCFLLKAKKGQVGTPRSTYFAWATFLGSAVRVDSYFMRTNGTMAKYHDDFGKDVTSEYFFHNTSLPTKGKSSQNGNFRHVFSIGLANESSAR